MNELAITLDVDWAPDWMIDDCAAILRDRDVKATWFVTHACDAVERLREEPELFELGIHPNFFPGSTHGSEPAEVIEHVLEIVPEATSMRTHGLLSSTRLMHEVAATTPIVTDVSTMLPHARGIAPVLHAWDGASLVRLPFFWADDHEMQLDRPSWDPEPLLEAGPGLRVINFHPIHVALNSSSMDAYRGLGPPAYATPEMVAEAAGTGEGARSMFEGLADLLASQETWRVRDVPERFPALWPLPG